MRILRRALLAVGVVILLLLALENALVFLLMLDLGVSRAMWITALEFSIFVFLAIVMARMGKVRPNRKKLKTNEQ